jgi:hypothetical protein
MPRTVERLVEMPLAAKNLDLLVVRTLFGNKHVEKTGTTVNPSYAISLDETHPPGSHLSIYTGNPNQSDSLVVLDLMHTMTFIGNPTFTINRQANVVTIQGFGHETTTPVTMTVSRVTDEVSIVFHTDSGKKGFIPHILSALGVRRSS